MISNAGYWPEDDAECAEKIDRIVGTGPMCRYVEDLPVLATIMSEGRINFEKRVIRAVKLFFHILINSLDI